MRMTIAAGEMIAQVPLKSPQAEAPAASGELPPIHPVAYPVRHRWTAEEYMELGNGGFMPGRRTELIDGEIYDVVSQNNPHVAAVSNATRILVATFDKRFWLTVQSTVRLPSGDIPEPDLAIRPGPSTRDNTHQPLPLLVVEVSDLTLLFDQIVKTSLYAANRIPEYWIINVNDNQIEVYRKPVEDAGRRFGWRYGELTVLRPPAFFSPLAMPDARIDVAEMLP
jgi:Uma2 family endonuclease